MKYLLKETLIPFLYLVFTATMAFSILMINDSLIWLKALLCALTLAIYACIVIVICEKEGETAYKVLLENDAERLQIIKTGEDRPLRTKEEYKAWKGFVFGLFACVPLIVLLIVNEILMAINPDFVGAGVVMNFMYMTFGAFIRLDSTATLTNIHNYFNLITVVIIPLLTGIPYMLGAKKIRKQQEMVMKKHRQIYDKD